MIGSVCSPRASRGFTLIELLVVIAIISLLAAILLPVFSAVRAKARQISCANNGKQIGTAMIAYTQDYDENYPFRILPAPGNPNQPLETKSWRVAINPYLKSTGVFVCPSNPNNQYGAGCIQDPTTGTYKCTGDPNAGPDGFNVSYACNMTSPAAGTPPPQGDGICADGAGGNTAPVSLASVSAPAQVIAVTESWLQWSEIQLQKQNQQALYAGHGGMSNYVFADGHVKALRPYDTISTTTASNGGMSGVGGSTDLWTRDNVVMTGTDATNAVNNLKQAANQVIQPKPVI